MNGLLGNNIWSQIGMGLLSSNAPSLTPQNPMQHIQQQMLLGNQMQQQKSKEEREAYKLQIEKEKWELQKKKHEQMQAMLQTGLAPSSSPNMAQLPHDPAASSDPSTMPYDLNNATMPTQLTSPSQTESPYLSSINERMGQIDRMLPMAPDVATYQSLQKEKISLLGEIDKVNGEKDFSDIKIEKHSGRPMGWHNRRNQWLYADDMTPVSDFKPTDVLSSAAYSQQIRKKKADTEIGQSGYRTKKINVNGIDYEQEIYRDVNGDEHVTSSRPVVETGFKVNQDNDPSTPDVVPQTGGTRDMNNPKNWTQDMRKGAGFTNRMLLAEMGINDVVANAKDLDITDYSIKSYATAASSDDWTSGARSAIYNADLSPDEQAYVNNAMDWIRAKLRKESGAVISAGEMAGEYATYFPVSGDSQKVIENKRKLRMQATRNMQMEAGEAWKADEAMGIPVPKTDDDFNVLPAGSLFIDDDGKVYRKQ